MFLNSEFWLLLVAVWFMAINTKKAGPILERAKAWTELSTPERVMKVPIIVRLKV